MIDLKKINFGCADANTEAERNPSEFKRVFFDPHEYIKELINGDKFILQGRKGDGKTTYGEQIKLAEAENGIYAYQKTLNNFNNTTFVKIKTYESLGGNPYISFWKCILMIECVRMLFEYNSNIQNMEFHALIEALKRNGFLWSDDISFTVHKLVEVNSTLHIKDIFENSKKHTYETEVYGAEQIYSTIKNIIKNIYIDKKFIVIIDGLDDLLNCSEFRSEIVMGLIRAVEEINRVFRKETLKVKIIILIRDDILDLCRDPNRSKLIRDYGLRLSWTILDSPYESNLIRLVEKRLVEGSNKQISFMQIWDEIFPKVMGSKPSLDYVLENIIYRPRDILQFFIEIQKQFVPGKKLTIDKVEHALRCYSNEYFVDAMRDELTGFFSNEVITILPKVLSTMGTHYFYLEDFENECKHYEEFENIAPDAVLERLFIEGYIGQHRPIEGKDFTVFSYRNSKVTFQPEYECIVHRGLIRALMI